LPKLKLFRDNRTIDKYELVVQPSLAGHGTTLFAGLSHDCLANRSRSDEGDNRRSSHFQQGTTAWPTKDTLS